MLEGILKGQVLKNDIFGQSSSEVGKWRKSLNFFTSLAASAIFTFSRNVILKPPKTISFVLLNRIKRIAAIKNSKSSGVENIILSPSEEKHFLTVWRCRSEKHSLR